jgi:hypothetical protein
MTGPFLMVFNNVLAANCTKESVSIVDKYDNTMLSYAALAIDIGENKVIKDRYAHGRDAYSLYVEYTSRYM